MAEDKGLRSIFERLQRIETRLVAGFEMMGLDVSALENAVRVDAATHAVYLKGASRSIRAIQLAIHAAGGDDGLYAVFIGDKAVATVKGGNHVD